MATFSKLAFQPTTMTVGTGLGTLVVATATAGTVIHTCSNVATHIDELWLYAYNNDTTSILLTVEFGGVTAPKDVIKSNISAKAGLVLICAGLVLQGNTSPVVVRAFAATASQISIFGYVNRITP